ncbi:FecR domain-containing protein [Janthinobacterium sp. PAMC25594]|uniref:FecR domain-containing protein n=1 Tax=Janthinobacterium sp. PAMC25594 TaxID=2861284 RepID=UPI001C636125|nr:FecR domain-containing protein [Janthinobacterium sp. PAMC25594]QYG07824.1 FecR domain-containing protein [Janthinobacterium sp. PAMC25594]
MTFPVTAAALPEDPVEQAIAWAVRLQMHGATPDALHSLQRWRDADPGHEQAWQRLAAIGSQFSGLPPEASRATLDASLARRRQRRQALKVLAGIGFAGTAAWFAIDTRADYRTGTGQRLAVRLPDGSLLQLNAGTAVRLRFDGAQRLLTLLHGDIAITTQADPQRRPFLVDTGEARMLALGTRFTVRRLAVAEGADAMLTRLAVQEHAVQLQAAASAARPLLVQAGDGVLTDGARIWREPAHDDPAAWLDGVIVARDMPLGQLVAELARHRHGLLLCDADIARLPVSGIFQLDDPERALRVLLHTQPIVAVYRTRFWVTLKKA